MDINELLRKNSSAFAVGATDEASSVGVKRKRTGDAAQPIGLDVDLYLRTKNELAAKERAEEPSSSSPLRGDAESRRSKMELGAFQAAMDHLKRYEGLMDNDNNNSEIDMRQVELQRLARDPVRRPVDIPDDVRYRFAAEGAGRVGVEVQVSRLHVAAVRHRQQLAAVDVKRCLVSSAIYSTVMGCTQRGGTKEAAQRKVAPHSCSALPSARPAVPAVQLLEGIDLNVDDLLGA